MNPSTFPPRVGGTSRAIALHLAMGISLGSLTGVGVSG